MKSASLTPTKLRLILAILLVMLTGAGVGVFTIGYRILTDFSQSSRSLASQAQASNSSLQDLITTKKELEENADVVDRASRIVAQSRSYEYQDIANTILPSYAAQAGLTITSISFANSQQTSATTPSGTATAAAVMTAPSGVKSMTITVALKNPVEYTRMLNFLHYIEQSLFIMHIKQVGLSKTADAKDDALVSSDILTIEVYIR